MDLLHICTFRSLINRLLMRADKPRTWILLNITNYFALGYHQYVSLFRLHGLNTSLKSSEQHVVFRKFPCNPAYGNI